MGGRCNSDLCDYRIFWNSPASKLQGADRTISSGLDESPRRGTGCECIRLLKEGLIKPYVTDEIFVNLDGTGFSQNRIYLGVVTKLHKNMSTNLYYAFQTIEDKEAWENNNIIGVDFTCYF